jgi:hypothetical protein
MVAYEGTEAASLAAVLSQMITSQITNSVNDQLQQQQQSYNPNITFDGKLSHGV